MDGHTLAVIWLLAWVVWSAAVILKVRIDSWRIDRSFRRDGLIWKRVRR